MMILFNPLEKSEALKEDRNEMSEDLISVVKLTLTA